MIYPSGRLWWLRFVLSIVCGERQSKRQPEYFRIVLARCALKFTFSARATGTPRRAVPRLSARLVPRLWVVRPKEPPARRVLRRRVVGIAAEPTILAANPARPIGLRDRGRARESSCGRPAK